MASEWMETVLQQIAAKSDHAFAMGPFGSNIKAENYRESGVPVIRGTNLGKVSEPPFISDGFVFVDKEKADDLGSSNCSANDIIFVAQGTVGKVGIIPANTPYRRFVLSQNLMKVTVDPERADPRFVFYFYRSSLGQHEIMSRVNPTGVPCISKPLTSLRQFAIRLPSDVQEQRAIAHILGALDDKIEGNRQMNATLEGMARALFKSWFLDFDPVRAKAEGREADLPKSSAELFPDSLEDSEVGEIPTGWHVGRIEDIAEINALTLSRTDPLDVIDYVEISEVMRGDIANIVRYKRGSEPSRARRRLRHGDTVLSTVRPDRGAYFLALNPAETLVASTGFAVLTPKSGVWAFLYSLVTRREVGEHLGRLADGGAYPAIRGEVIGRIRVPLPQTFEPILGFEQLARPLYEKSAQNRTQSQTLGQLRDALLPRLISGELRVPDAERIVGRQI